MNYIGSIILESAYKAEDTVVTNIDGKLQAQAIFQDVDTKNRNGREYMKADMKAELEGDRIKELIGAKSFCGEYGHPVTDEGGLTRQQTIDPKLVSHRINKIWMEGNLIKGIYEPAGPYGKYVESDLRNGVLPAFSLRALGSIENINGRAVVKNIKIITYDLVYYPSHKKAYTEKLITESGIVTMPNQIIVPNGDPGKVINLTDGDAKYVLSRLQRESASLAAITETFNGLYNNITLLEDGKTLLMTDNFGGEIRVPLEKHVQNVIMDYVTGI